MSHIRQTASFIVAIGFFTWACLDPGFRDTEGFLTGRFCFPVTAGIAFFIIGIGIRINFFKSSLLFALSLLGNAAALQLIDAGPLIRYQHYKEIDGLLSGIYPFILSLLLTQAIIVIAGLKIHWKDIKSWIARNFAIWQLIGMAFLFWLFSSAMSFDRIRYLNEMILATCIQSIQLGNIILFAWTLHEAMNRNSKHQPDKFPAANEINNSFNVGHLDRFSILAALFVTITASLLCFFSYEKIPHVPDEVMYLFQARYFAKGLLNVQAPPVPEAFTIYMVPYESQEWYSIFPPGWPAVLALGVLLGIPWLVNPILAGVNILLAYALMRELTHKHRARLIIIMLCFSPWNIFMAMSFMSHTITLTCALIAFLAIALARKSGNAFWGLIGGIATGMTSLIRPLDGLILALTLGLWAIGSGGRRLKMTPIAAFVCGTILIGAVNFTYNKQITGNPTVPPLTAYYEKYYGHKFNALGFGPERGFGWWGSVDPIPGHSIFEALVNNNCNAFLINTELFGWSTGSLIFFIFLLLSRKIKKNDIFLMAIPVGIAGIYSLYWFGGGPDFGARYWYLMIIPLTALTARGLQVLQEMFKIGQSNSPPIPSLILYAVLALCIISAINYIPWRAIDKYHHYRRMRPDIENLEKKHNFGKSLVLIQGDYPDYQASWMYNPLDYRADAPIYAWDKNRIIRDKLLKEFHDRPVWLIKGHSITKAGFEVSEGPISNEKLTSREKNGTYDLIFSTYLGGSGNVNRPRSIFVDSTGNLFIAGGTTSTDFPTTPGAYDRTFATGGTKIGKEGFMDAFISKFDSSGKLVWSTLLGGPNFDCAHAITVDKKGDVYISGRAGPGFPVTTGTFQSEFHGTTTETYGWQNAFVSKLSSEGSTLIWSSYLGYGQEMCLDIAVDENGNVYAPIYYPGRGVLPPSEWFAHGFQKSPKGGSECGVITIKNDGFHVLWATWLGGSSNESEGASVLVDNKGYVCMALSTVSDDMPTTAGTADRHYYNDGKTDLFIGKLSPDGSDLVFGTYLGGKGDQWADNQTIVFDDSNNIYATFGTFGDLPVIAPIFQNTYGGGSSDIGVLKLSPSGKLLQSTYIGGDGMDVPSGISIDRGGNIFIGGNSNSSDFPVTPDAFQSHLAGGTNMVCCKLSPDLDNAQYISYFGGSYGDDCRIGCAGPNGTLCLAGETHSRDLPMVNAFQNGFSRGISDGIVAAFSMKSKMNF